MTMECIRTGFHGYLSEYNQWVYGDAFAAAPSGTGNALLILRVVEVTEKPVALVRHFTVYKIDEWFDRDETGANPKNLTAQHSTLISASYENHGYEGTQEQIVPADSSELKDNQTEEEPEQ